jgi:secreted PhoX family phosphatase
MPDNCVIAPWGDVLFCEDGDRDDRLMGLTPEGELYELAHNALTGQEMAGVCFSPDGQVMFLNLQRDGVTLAVRGPFPRG